MTLKDDLGKFKKRQRLGLNKLQGKLGEGLFETSRRAQGYEVKRKPHGRDYEERKVDLITGKKGRRVSVEVKTGNARLSPLQKKRKSKSKSYRVERI